MIARTRKGVFGVARKRNGSPRRKQAAATSVLRMGPCASDMAQHDLSRASPPDRNQVAHPATDDQTAGAMAVTQEAVGIEECARIETVAPLPRDELTAMQVTGQRQLEAALARGLPDA